MTLHEIRSAVKSVDESRQTFMEINVMLVEAEERLDLLENPPLSGVSAGINIITITADYTVLTSDDMINVDATSGPITVTLPAILERLGREIMVKKIDSSFNTVAVDGNGSETIDEGLTAVLTIQYEEINFANNLVGWWIK